MRPETARELTLGYCDSPSLSPPPYAKGVTEKPSRGEPRARPSKRNRRGGCPRGAHRNTDGPGGSFVPVFLAFVLIILRTSVPARSGGSPLVWAPSTDSRS
ncbi:hypothetical protein NDU88_005021 [Pleurodeles waltl]|uniref:Uncharacterized protein n=1 Tax=Pleurodeles waltl TaxID=8319 RepID=A0AAV7NMR9_PLEWA|nr:hypothetical protein NDU88_005021 [Pleurodeles waltl]